MARQGRWSKEWEELKPYVQARCVRMPASRPVVYTKQEVHALRESYRAWVWAQHNQGSR